MSNNNNNNEYLLKVDHLKQYFPVKDGFKTLQLKAVDDVSFAIRPGETLGLVGESGCGKTTTGRTLLRLYEPTAGRITYDGNVIYDSGLPILGPDGKELPGKKVSADMHPYRRKMQIVFQDPYASLDPRMTVGDIIGEGIDLHHLAKDSQDRYNQIIKLLEDVGLNSEHANRYPHEFSGGQRQRICIARALALNPEFVVCDEPVSALDVSIQAQIINLLKELQGEYNLTYLFISHDLSVVEHISDTVGVMYLGNLVEYGETADIFKNPLHPYTKALFSAIPIPDPKAVRNRIVLEGSIPSPANPPKGCKFHTRCPYATERCKCEVPAQKEVEPGHFVVCHLFDE